jgi:hypothetical protein
MLYAADKYKLPGMMEQCMDFLMDHVDEANCLVVFNQTHRLDCGRINDKCLKMIQEDPLKFFEDAFFPELQFTAVQKMLGLPSMNCNGACLKRAVFSWFLANKVCKPSEINNDAVLLRRGLRTEDFVDKPFHSVMREGHHLLETRTFKSNFTRSEILTDRWLFGVGLCLGIPGNKPIDEKVKLTILHNNVGIFSVERTVKQSQYFSIEEIMFKKVKVPRGMLCLVVEYELEQTRCVTTHSICDIEQHFICGPFFYCDEGFRKGKILRAVDKNERYTCLTHLIYANVN